MKFSFQKVCEKFALFCSISNAAPSSHPTPPNVLPFVLLARMPPPLSCERTNLNPASFLRQSPGVPQNPTGNSRSFVVEQTEENHPKPAKNEGSSFKELLFICCISLAPFFQATSSSSKLDRCMPKLAWYRENQYDFETGHQYSIFV